MRFLLATVIFFSAAFSAGTALAQSIEDTADSLETAIGELQSALDDLEEYRGTADDDLGSALRSVRVAHQTMRATAISLLVGSLDPNRPKEFQRTISALRILEPKIFDKPNIPGSKP